MKYLHVNAQIHNEIKLLLLSSSPPKKMGAIKLLRSNVACTLREGKHAIEFELGQTVGSSARIITKPRILNVTCDFGDGAFNISLDEMELTGLMNIERFGIEACMDVVELVTTLKAYAHGAKIGVID